MTYEELEAFCIECGFPKFRAKQIYEWMHKKLVRSVDEMTNLPLGMREQLKEHMITVNVVER